MALSSGHGNKPAPMGKIRFCPGFDGGKLIEDTLPEIHTVGIVIKSSSRDVRENSLGFLHDSKAGEFEGGHPRRADKLGRTANGIRLVWVFTNQEEDGELVIG